MLFAVNIKNVAVFLRSPKCLFFLYMETLF